MLTPIEIDLAHHTAEMASIGGTTDVNGQLGMMLGADAAGRNAVMYPQGFRYGPGEFYGIGAYSLPGMSSQASPLHDAGISGAAMYGSSAVITSGGKSVAGQVTSTSATQVEKPKKKKKKNKVLGFLKDAADFLILDDVKTVFDPKASFLDKGVAIFSVTPTGKAVKAGRLGFKLVRNSPFGKGIVKKVDQMTNKETGKATIPVKTGGGSDPANFVNEHAATRHIHDSSTPSTPSKTQYGKDVDVKKLVEDTKKNADSVETKYTDLANGKAGITVYKKKYEGNISTKDTPTGQHRVFDNHDNPAKSSHFPYVDRKK